MDARMVGQKIHDLRKQKGWTQAELGQRLGVTDKAISKWERGGNFPDIALLEKISQELDISIAELLGVEEQNQESIVQSMVELSKEEQAEIGLEMVHRGWFDFVVIALILVAYGYGARIILNFEPILESEHYTIISTLSSMSVFLNIPLVTSIRSIWLGKKLIGKNRKEKSC